MTGPRLDGATIAVLDVLLDAWKRSATEMLRAASEYGEKTCVVRFDELVLATGAEGRIVDLNGTVSALRADSGAVAWRVAAGAGVQGTPAVARGRVYVPTVGNKLIALALADGKPLWTA